MYCSLARECRWVPFADLQLAPVGVRLVLLIEGAHLDYLWRALQFNDGARDSAMA